MIELYVYQNARCNDEKKIKKKKQVGVIYGAEWRALLQMLLYSPPTPVQQCFIVSYNGLLQQAISFTQQIF